MLTPTVGGPLIFLLIPLFVIGAAAAFIVAVDSITDRNLTPADRLIGLALSAAVIPAGILGLFVAGSVGSFGPRPEPIEQLVTAAAAVTAIVMLLAVKPRAWQIMKKNEWRP